jgi:hypothetical protein
LLQEIAAEITSRDALEKSPDFEIT